MNSRWLRSGLLASLGILAVGCGPIFQKRKPSVERVNASIPGGRFQVIATIAGGDSRTDIRMSATVRQVLQDSGFTAVRRAGRWDSEADAVRQICEPVGTVDGVLVIWYDRMVLRECRTLTSAYEVEAGNEKGITDMANSLIRYLRREPGAPPRD
jgi:hypothetical protein